MRQPRRSAPARNWTVASMQTIEETSMSRPPLFNAYKHQVNGARDSVSSAVVLTRCKSVKFLAAREHVDDQFHTLDLRLFALCRLQPVGDRIQIGFVERRIELLCLRVARELFHELGRHRCGGGRIVRSGPAPVGFGCLHFREASGRHLALADKPIHMRDIYLRPAAFCPSWSEFLHPRGFVKRQLLSVYPTKTQRLIERFAIGYRRHTGAFLVNSQE